MSAAHVLWRLRCGAAIGMAAALSAVPAASLPVRTAPAPTAQDAIPVVQAQASQGTVSPDHVPAPDLFEATGTAVWDGRRTLQGVWVAHPLATSARRVRIFNTETGEAVDGALFQRDAVLTGPAVLISSEAAQSLGMSPGDESNLRIVALTPARPAPAAGTVEDDTAATDGDSAGQAVAQPAAAETGAVGPDGVEPEVREGGRRAPVGPGTAELSGDGSKPATAESPGTALPTSLPASAPGTGTESASARPPAPRPIPPTAATAVVGDWAESPGAVFRPAPTRGAAADGSRAGDAPAVPSADQPADTAAVTGETAEDGPEPSVVVPSEPAVGSTAAPSRPVFQAAPVIRVPSAIPFVEPARPPEPDLSRAAPEAATSEPATADLASREPAIEETVVDLGTQPPAAVESAGPAADPAAPAPVRSEPAAAEPAVHAVEPVARAPAHVEPAAAEPEPPAAESLAPAPARTEPHAIGFAVPAAEPAVPASANMIFAAPDLALPAPPVMEPAATEIPAAEPIGDADEPTAPPERIARAQPPAASWVEVARSAAAGPLSRPYVQAGIFGVAENASQLIDRLEAADLPALGRPMTLGGRPATRVLAGPFSAEAERDAALRTIRDMGLSDAAPVAR